MHPSINKVRDANFNLCILSLVMFFRLNLID